MSSSETQSPGHQKRAPEPVIVVAVATFIGLLLVAAVFAVPGGLHNWVHSVRLGRLPIAIGWFGAVGGSLNSLTGIFKHHTKDWDCRYNAWHPMRPWTGAVMGALGAFFLLVVTEVATLGSSTPTSGQLPINPDIYYAAAFIAGFAEESFREMVGRLTHVIVGPRNDTNP